MSPKEEQEKFPEKELNEMDEMEATKVPEVEFKTMVSYKNAQGP